MPYGFATVYELLQGKDADLQVSFHKLAVYFPVAFAGFNAIGRHGLVAYQEQGAGGYFIEEAGSENRGCFHIDGHGANFFQVGFKLGIVFPHPAVGGIAGTGPIIVAFVADGGGNGFLQGEGGEGGHLGRKVIVAGTFAPNGGNRQNQIAHLVLVFESAALA